MGAIAGKRKSWRPLPDVSSINAEQMLAADGETIKRPKDRVGHQPCLVGKENNGQRRQDQRQLEIAAKGAKMAGERDARAARRDSGDDRNRRRQGDGREHEAVPDQRRIKRQQQSGEKGEDRERRREGAAQNYRAFSTDRWPDGAGIPGGAGGHDAVKAFSELN